MVPRGEGKAMDCDALGLGRGVSQQNGILFNSCAMGSLNSPPIDVYYRNDLRVDGRLGRGLQPITHGFPINAWG